MEYIPQIKRTKLFPFKQAFSVFYFNAKSLGLLELHILQTSERHVTKNKEDIK